MTGQKTKDQALKRPDSFQDQILKAIQFLSNNKKRIFMMISPVLVVAAVGYGVFVWTQKQALTRRAELSKVLASHSDEQMAVSRQREEIQKQITALRNAKTEKDGKKSQLSAENLAEITSLEKKVADLKPDHTKSMAEFKKFYDSHTADVEGWMAGLTWASYQLQNGKNDDARKVVEQVSKASSTNNFYQMNSRFMLISLLEDAGEFDAALKECDLLSKIATDDAKPSLLLAKGRLQFHKKAFSEAKAALNEILDKHSTSPEATKARGLIALIGSV